MDSKKDPRASHASDSEHKNEVDMTKAELFKLYAEDPSIWLLQGVRLLRASYPLWNVFWRRREDLIANKGAEVIDLSTDGFVQAYLLLSGFAFENLIKGLIVYQENLKVKDGKLPEEVYGHKLVKLAERAGHALHGDEKTLLTDLTQAIVWQGRYRSPTKEARLSDKDPARDYGWKFRHPKIATQLFTSIMLEYPEASLSGQQEQISLQNLAALLERECPEIR